MPAGKPPLTERRMHKPVVSEMRLGALRCFERPVGASCPLSGTGVSPPAPEATARGASGRGGEWEQRGRAEPSLVSGC